MHGDDAKQNDNIVAYVPEHGGNLAVEAHNISVVSQFEITCARTAESSGGIPRASISWEAISGW